MVSTSPNLKEETVVKALLVLVGILVLVVTAGLYGWYSLWNANRQNREPE